MNKRGFTLIEIIVCIALIALVGIGSTVIIVSVNNKKEIDLLENNNESFLNALNIYLETNKEILENVYNNVEGAVVSLELLKNKGLIEDNLNIDYKNNFFVVSDAVLVNNDAEGEEKCKGRISIEVIKSWDLSKYNSSEVLYICPKDSSTNNNSGSNNTTINIYNFNENTTFKGPNVNNWVKFDVIPNNHSDIYFEEQENQNEDLWRILRFTQDGEIKLIYNTSIKGGISYNQLIANIPDSDYQIKYDKSKVLNYLSNENNYVKYILYNSIVNKNWIEKKDYYYYLTYPWTYITTWPDTEWVGVYDINILNATQIDKTKKYNDYIGNINLVEFRATLNDYNETYLEKQIIAYAYTRHAAGETSSSTKYEGGNRVIMPEIDSNNTYTGVTFSKYIDDDVLNKIYTFNPVVTLKNTIKLKSPTNCPEGSEVGSKTCPFELIDANE